MWPRTLPNPEPLFVGAAFLSLIPIPTHPRPPATVSIATINSYFELRLTRSGYGLVSDPIPFNAFALGADERPDVSTLDSLVTCENDGSNDDTCPSLRLGKSGSMQMKVRVGVSVI